MTEKVWCEHMHILSDNLRKGADIKMPQITTLFGLEIKFCPICGAPRPAPKSLEQVLRDRFWSRAVEFETWESIAKKAKELILDGKEEGIFEILQQRTMIRDSERIFIAKEILTYLRESC